MRKGFTLIELSIVLVIIGLIVGGVLVGRDLIKAAQLRKVMTQYEQFETAINTFDSKYDCLPGDCANASGFFSGATNGNGNGVIEAMEISWGTACFSGRWNGGLGAAACGNTSLSGITNEGMLQWEHLSQAGLVPVGAFLSTGGFATANTQTILDSRMMSLFAFYIPNIGHVIGTAELINSYMYMGGTYDGPYMYPIDAQSIDAKVDDGLPFTGRVHGVWLNYDTNNSPLLFDSNGCSQDAGGNTYTINQYDTSANYAMTGNGHNGCTLQMKANF